MYFSLTLGSITKEIREVVETNPLLSLLLLICCIMYILLGFSYRKNKLLLFIAEPVLVLIFFLSLFQLTTPPFTYMHPQVLSSSNPVHLRIAWVLQSAFYAFSAIVLSVKLEYFLKQLPSLLPRIMFGNPGLWMLILFTSYSAVWSNFPVSTLNEVLIFLIFNAFAIYIGVMFDFKAISGYMRWSLLLIALLSLPYVNQISFEGGVDGIMYSKNQFGCAMAISTVLWFSHFLFQSKKGWISLWFSALSFILMILANSTGGLLVFLSLGVLPIFIQVISRLNFRAAFLLEVIFILLSFISAYALIGYQEEILGFFGKDLSLTGRADIWPQILKSAMEKPWLGYGFSSFWEPQLGQENPAAGIFVRSTGWIPNSAHNGYLDLLLELGLVGCLLFAISFVFTLCLILKYISLRGLSNAYVPLTIVLLLFIRNLSESQLLGMNYIWFFYVVVVVRLSFETKINMHRQLASPNMLLVKRIGK